MIALFSGFAALLQGASKSPGATAAGMIAALASAFLLGRCSVDVSAKCNARNLTAVVKGQARRDEADGVAQGERIADDNAARARSNEVKEAIDAVPDQALTARQRARACTVMRQQGARPDALASAGC